MSFTRRRWLNWARRYWGRSRVGFSDAHTEAVGKAISSAITGLGATLSAEYGEVSFKVDQVADLAFGGMLVVPLDIIGAMGRRYRCMLYFEGQFLGSALSSGGRERRRYGKGGASIR